MIHENSYDALGSTMGLLTDYPEADDWNEFYRYDAWGNITDGSGVDNPFLWAGYYHDEETNDYYCNNRYYKPTLARWTQNDPYQYVDGLNMYEYVRNNPIQLFDPLGLHPWDHPESEPLWDVNLCCAWCGYELLFHKALPVHDLCVKNCFSYDTGLMGSDSNFDPMPGGSTKTLVNKIWSEILREKGREIPRGYSPFPEETCSYDRTEMLTAARVACRNKCKELENSAEQMANRKIEVINNGIDFKNEHLMSEYGREMDAWNKVNRLALRRIENCWRKASRLTGIEKTRQENGCRKLEMDLEHKNPQPPEPELMGYIPYVDYDFQCEKNCNSIKF